MLRCLSSWAGVAEAACARLVRRPVGLEGDQIADHPERVAPPLGGRNDALDLVGEEERADPVVLPRRGQRQHRGHLDRQRRPWCAGSPNWVEPDWSTTSISVSSRSSVKVLT